MSNIAIIGSGNMAAGLAAALTAAGKNVFIGARDAAKAQALAQKTGAQAQGGTLAQAVAAAQTVFLALPYAAAAEVLQQLDVSGKTLIDISNPVTADFQNLSLGFTTSAAEEIAKAAPQAAVVKGFNTVFAQLLDPAARSGQTVQVFLAADDEEAKKRAAALTADMGFKAVDAGGLRNSRFLEPLGEMNILFGFFLGKGTGIAPMWSGLENRFGMSRADFAHIQTPTLLLAGEKDQKRPARYRTCRLPRHAQGATRHRCQRPARRAAKRLSRRLGDD